MKKLLAGLAVSALVLFSFAPSADARFGGGFGGGFGGFHGGAMAFGGRGFAPGFGMRGFGLARPGFGFRGGFVRPGFGFRRRFFPGFGFATAVPFGFGGFGGFGGGDVCESLTTGQVFAC